MKFFKLLLVPVFAFSFEIKFDKKFYHELSHDTLSADVTVTIIDKTDIKVGDRLNGFDEKIKSFDKVEKKFESLNIRPRFRHASDMPRHRGYVGDLKYIINSRKARFMDEFVKEITNLKRNRDTVVSVKNLAWKVREDTYNVTFDLLRLEAINWGINYSKNVSKDLNKTCTLKDIEIDKQNQLMTLNSNRIYSKESATTKAIPIPESSLEKIVIFANYILECK